MYDRNNILTESGISQFI